MSPAAPPAGASLVIAPQWIGDAVMAEPLLRRLQARGERLTAAALPWVAPVLRAMPAVAEVIELPFTRGALQLSARRALARTLAGRFDTAYVLPNSLKSALLPLLAGIARRVGYLGEARVGLLTHRLPNPKPRPPMVAFYLALSGERGPYDLAGADRPRLVVPPDAVAAALARHGLAPQAFSVLAPGAEYGPAKRWPPQRYAELAQALAARWPGQPVLLLGSEKEAAPAQAIADAAPGVGRNLAGRTTLDEALALIAGAARVVSNDSGLMHVAAALTVPQVALFGSSSPLLTPPLSPMARVVWLRQEADYRPPLDCAPCFERECPLGHTRCLADIDAARVLALLP